VALRNGPGGYGLVTKALHWTTVGAVAGQFAVGYSLGGGGHGRGRGRGHGSGHGRGHGGEDLSDRLDGLGNGIDLVELRVALGAFIAVLALLRIGWRRTGLPPWSPRLSPPEQRVVALTERALLGLLLVVPATGLLLVLADDDLLWAHVTAHALFFGALFAHLGVVIGRGLVPRMT
jgi:cytochrome b561